jgi:hypothetical protein
MTPILGVEVSVAAVVMDDAGRIKAVCERNGEQQRIDLIDLPLPSRPSPGAEWIAAYRRWREAASWRMKKKSRTNSRIRVRSAGRIPRSAAGAVSRQMLAIRKRAHMVFDGVATGARRLGGFCNRHAAAFTRQLQDFDG